MAVFRNHRFPEVFDSIKEFLGETFGFFALGRTSAEKNCGYAVNI
jgi:hypothetical protein